MTGIPPNTENSLENLAHIANMTSQQLPGVNQSLSNINNITRESLSNMRGRSKRMACVECRQQKSKCDAHERAPLPCTRCSKRKLECDLKSDYKRTYKRARIAQIEKEFNELRKSLSSGGTELIKAPFFSRDSMLSSQPPLLPMHSGALEMNQEMFNNNNNMQGSPSDIQYPQSLVQKTNFGLSGHYPPNNPVINNQFQESPSQMLSILPSFQGIRSSENTTNSGTPSLSHTPNIPSVIRDVPMIEPAATDYEIYANHVSQTKNHSIDEEVLKCQPKSISGVSLSSEQIKLLFLEYFEFYHPILPVVDIIKGPERIYKLCPALFWVIMLISLRRFNEDSKRALLMELGPIVKNILSEITISPITRYNPTEMDQPILNVSSVYSVQAFLLYTFWPPITSSLSADSSWNTIGVALFQAIRIGLHSPGQSTDFSTDKVDSKHLALLTEHVKTWIACNIVSQIIATSFGFPAFVQFDSSSLSVCRPGSEIIIPKSLKIMMEIAHFEDQVAKTLNSNSMDPYGLIDVTERLPLLQVLSNQLDELEIKFMNQPEMDDFRRFQLLAARVHLLTYYFLDTTRIASFELQKGLVKVYNAALALITFAEISQAKNKTFVKYLPGVYMLNIWQAAFIVGKLTHSPLKSIVDLGSGKVSYQSAVTLAAKASILKHDMAYRSSGIMRNMWQLLRTLDSKNMTSYGVKIRTRMAASVFFDCLYILREQVGMVKLVNNNNENVVEEDDESQSFEEGEEYDDEYDEAIEGNDESAIISDDAGTVGKNTDSKGDNTSTPGSIKSNNSTKSKKIRSLSNTMNPESSARKIIRTIPLDPQPISVTNKEKAKFFQTEGNTAEIKNQHGNRKDAPQSREPKSKTKTKKLKPKKPRPILPATAILPNPGSISQRQNPTAVNVRGSLFASIRPAVKNEQYQGQVVNSAPKGDISMNSFSYKGTATEDSPLQNGLEAFELDNWEINGDLLWKDVDSVMNDFGFHPQ